MPVLRKRERRPLPVEMNEQRQGMPLGTMFPLQYPSWPDHHSLVMRPTLEDPGQGYRQGRQVPDGGGRSPARFPAVKALSASYNVRALGRIPERFQRRIHIVLSDREQSEVSR